MSFRPVLELLNQRPVGAGKVFFVEASGGSDSNEGTDPNFPLVGIQAGIDKCTALYDDYVIVMQRATSDIVTTTPILANKRKLHLIGLSNWNSQGAGIRVVHTTETDDVVQIIKDTGDHTEIAGFGFSGGTTARVVDAVSFGPGGIFARGHSAWIHHCNFGSRFTSGTPDYGIYNGVGNDMQMSVIEDNTFYGSANSGQGLISVDGIYIYSIANYNLIIRRNTFLGIPGVAINIANGSFGVQILDNLISIGSSVAGKSITLGAASLGCFVDGNHCQFGDSDSEANGRMLDNAAGDANVWGTNYAGGTAVYPA